MIENKEKRFETDIETSLKTFGGWQTKTFKQCGFDAGIGLSLDVLIDFVKETQPKAWLRYEKIYGQDLTRDMFLKRFNEEVASKGMLGVLRNGFKDRGVAFRVAYFRPVSALNDDILKKYEANRFFVVRQFAFSAVTKQTIDLVLMVNGIPLVAMELKNQYTNQTVEHAKIQFQEDRDPKEVVFKFNTRFLVYFAIDHYEAWMTTKLAKNKTYFLPFNQGSNGAGVVGGAGNPPHDGYPTAYLWETVLKKDNLMDIFQNFMNLQIKKEKEGTREVTKRTLIFPRYHQLDVVQKLLSDVKTQGSGVNYLIQHSAGSGKSNSIAWLAYHLASVHDESSEPIFRSVIIVTDRTVLDRQLQNTILSFDHTVGQVETIGDNKTSQDLKNAINDGKKIIITTLQKFPYIYDEVDAFKRSKFAIIVDEAHTSQTGESAQKLKTALADKSLSLQEFQEIEDRIIEGTPDEQDALVQTLLAQGRHDNLSFFAFTATPKERTLEMFGTKQVDGTFKPFHTYSMRQAIEEGFILDVLQNYMTYKESYRIAKEIEANPELPDTEAVKAIARYKSFHPWVLRQKTEIMVEQFREVTRKAINRTGKAVVVTPSRLHAVRYMKAFKDYIHEKGYTDLDVLVAFSGTVNDEGMEYREPDLNIKKSGEKISEAALKSEFHSEAFNLLIVAEKYQTGFDEPLLHTMFVDKKLRGVKAVQTLSRLNRICPGKKDTFILDFVNEKDDILDAFKPYYEGTTLEKEININLIYDTQSKLREFRLYNKEDIDAVINILNQAQKRQDERLLGRLSSLFKPVLGRYTDLEEKSQYEFRVTLSNFNKWYNYVAQIDRTFDLELLEESIYTSYLLKFIPSKKRDSVDLTDKIRLEFYRLKKDFEGDLKLSSGPVDALKHPETIREPEMPYMTTNPLEQIIRRINELFPDDFSESDKVIVGEIFKRYKSQSDSRLINMAKNNSQEMFVKNLFKDDFQNRIIEMYMENTDAFQKLVGGNPEYYESVYALIAKELYKFYRSQDGT